MINAAIDYNYLLIENYRKLNISEEELATIFIIEHLIKDGNAFISADLLSLKMSMDIQKIDEILTNLLTKGFIAYTTKNRKTITTLEPLYKRLEDEMRISQNKQEVASSKDVNEVLENIYGQFQSLLGRSLSPVEISKIGEWVTTCGYSEDAIINALKDCLNSGKKSLRSVDKLLLKWSTSEDIKSEGFTARREDWDKDLEETIRIAKTRWLDDDK